MFKVKLKKEDFVFQIKRKEVWFNDQLKIEFPNNVENWYKNGVLHREDGPAVVNGIHIEWHLNGKLHRTDGPAMQYYDIEEWYINGEKQDV